MSIGHRFTFLDQYRNMHQIIEEDSEEKRGALWLGDYTAALDKECLKSKGINTVLTTAKGLILSYPSSYKITHRQWIILDHPSFNIQRYFADVISEIEQGLKRGGVLVHCAAGVSRSASCVIAYLMQQRALTYPSAINFVKRKRRVISPNPGFLKQLQSFDKQLSNLLGNVRRSTFMSNSNTQYSPSNRNYSNSLNNNSNTNNNNQNNSNSNDNNNNNINSKTINQNSNVNNIHNQNSHYFSGVNWNNNSINQNQIDPSFSDTVYFTNQRSTQSENRNTLIGKKNHSKFNAENYSNQSEIMKDDKRQTFNKINTNSMVILNHNNNNILKPKNQIEKNNNEEKQPMNSAELIKSKSHKFVLKQNDSKETIRFNRNSSIGSQNNFINIQKQMEQSDAKQYPQTTKSIGQSTLFDMLYLQQQLKRKSSLKPQQSSTHTIPQNVPSTTKSNTMFISQAQKNLRKTFSYLIPSKSKITNN